jgi:hypothetical protein
MATIHDAPSIAIRHHQAGHWEATDAIDRQLVAVEHSQRAIGRKADEPMSYSNLGEADRGLKKVPEAIASYVRTDPGTPSRPGQAMATGQAVF